MIGWMIGANSLSVYKSQFCYVKIALSLIAGVSSLSLGRVFACVYRLQDTTTSLLYFILSFIYIHTKMFKVILLVAFVALFATLASAGTCTIPNGPQCLSLGESCNPADTVGSPAKVACVESYCYVNATSTGNGTCTAFIEENQVCNATPGNVLCIPGTSCQSDKCQQFGYGQNGDACESDFQCGASLVCTSKVCSIPAVNPIPAGNQCPFGQFLNGTNCNATIALGADCTANVGSGVCGYGNTCNKFNETNYSCIALYSLANGANCSDATTPLGVIAQACDAAAGLYCHDGTCAPIPTPSAEGTTCSGVNTGCVANFETCVCDGAKEVCQQSFAHTNETMGECKDAVLAYFSCMTENKCVDVGSNNNNACTEKCSSQECDITSACYIASEIEITTCDATEAVNTYTCSSSSASAIQASIMFVLVAAFALLF
ncbi:paramecium surface antigen repeat-containing protein [Cavenderia fasciculata]|uniref:Paramecium surface antigen repeat-containing protein n=1 Tax=Cavenderia fasciculata TaxID=261658 RepID=F4PNE3_CACFS|nr:paramecium surface antigen repeat-containing protein [Cavenderia fasciculata]EGG22996.1 paramecium surface antigen repeat-containing protein [Cavenderia fasciculata]|eukprot:XP_004360847.1 paramecium surface antigen repeat-containing protein [Cavenderia fasciculata]